MLRQPSATTLLALPGWVALASCLGPVPGPGAHVGGDPDQGPHAAWTLRDFRGNPWPLEGAPRRPHLEIPLQGPLEDEATGAILVAGPASDDLFDDASKSPLRKGTEALRIESLVHVHDGVLTLTPVPPLQPGSTYTAVLTAWAGPGPEGNEPTLTSFVVSPAPEAGAEVVALWPAHGTASVPRNVAWIAAALDGEAEGLAEHLTLRRDDGSLHPVQGKAVPCTDVGWTAAACAMAVPEVPLVEGLTYAVSIEAGVTDATGAPVPTAEAMFTAGAPDFAPPVPLPTPCPVDGATTVVGCSVADDRGVTLQFALNEPVRVSLTWPGGASADVAPRGDGALLARDLGPSAHHAGTFVATDLAGNAWSTALSLETLSSLAPITVTEVCANPVGPEPAQEYVEVTNFGDGPVDLGGFTLTDDPMRAGDTIPGPALVPARSRALVVPRAFDPLADGDAPIPAGVLLLRVEGSLGTGGLASTGEPVLLRDAFGHRLGAAPALAAPTPGQCALRRSTHRRDALPDDWGMGPCTPGLASPAEARTP